jgi:hypothetical protein
VIAGILRLPNSEALSVRTNRNKRIERADRDARIAAFEARNHTTKLAKNAMYALQLNGGHATTISATASHAITFLAINIRRFVRKGDAAIASRSRRLPE